MLKRHYSHLLPAAVLGLLVAVAFSTSAVASAPRSSAHSAYSQLFRDFHRILTKPGSQIRADQRRFEKNTAPCLTRVFTAIIVDQSPGSTSAGAARAAVQPLLIEAAFQMIMQSAKPLLTPYVHALKLAINISGLTGPKRADAVEFADVFAQGARVRTCADATSWAAANYSATSLPQGLLLTARLEKVANDNFPNSGKFRGFTSAQQASLLQLIKQAGKRFQSVIKQIDTRGTPWLENVLLTAKQDAAQQTTTTTTTTPTTTTP